VSEVQEAFDAITAGSRARDLESATLDFKRDAPSANDTVSTVAGAIACFANAQGGIVVVGVADAVPGTAAYLGTRLDPDQTKRQVFDRTDPHLVVAAEVVEVAGARLLVVSTPASSTVHSAGGRYTERLGASCQPMSSERIAQVLTDRRGEDWSAVDSGVPTSAADAVALAHARANLAVQPSPRPRGYASLQDADLLRALGVVTATGTLTNAGALLFTATIQTVHLAYSHRRSQTGALTANEQLRPPVMTALQRVLDLIDARLDRTSVNLTGGQQVQVADIPEATAREAVVNAVMHRDYRRPDRIVVDHSPGGLSVTSPGGFVSGVTADNVLTTSSRMRNPQLAGAIRTLGLAETAGTGVDRMYAEMTRTGHQPPAYTGDLAEVTITLLGGRPNVPLVRFASGLPVDLRDDADAMVVLRTLLDAGKVTARTFAPLIQRPEEEAERSLERLAVDPLGFLEPTRESVRWTHPEYRLRAEAISALGSAVAARRRPAEESEARVLDLVAEAGEITPGMVRAMLGVQPATVSRLLAGMIKRGLVSKTSRSARGRGVTYGPGPEMPTRKGRSRQAPERGVGHDTMDPDDAPHRTPHDASDLE